MALKSESPKWIQGFFAWISDRVAAQAGEEILSWGNVVRRNEAMTRRVCRELSLSSH